LQKYIQSQLKNSTIKKSFREKNETLTMGTNREDSAFKTKSRWVSMARSVPTTPTTNLAREILKTDSRKTTGPLSASAATMT